MAGSQSAWAPVTSGIPQGSVLGPVLFVCYINDMPDVVTSLIFIYADDTKIVRKISTEDDRRELQGDLNDLIGWTRPWQLKFNAAKCKVMHIGSGNGCRGYTMEECGQLVQLENTTEEKDLGIWFDNKLRFSTHIGNAVSKANKILGLIKRSFVYKDEFVMKRLFTALVRPHLEYGNVIWSPQYKCDVDRIERVQRRATKMIPGFRTLSYESRLQKLDLPSLVYRRYRGDAIETYKYLNGYYAVDSSAFLPLDPNHHNTRGHTQKLLKRRCRTQRRLNSFGFRVVNMWNNLPDYVVSAPTVNSFKSRLDKHWTHLKFEMKTDLFKS